MAISKPRMPSKYVSCPYCRVLIPFDYQKYVICGICSNTCNVITFKDGTVFMEKEVNYTHTEDHNDTVKKVIKRKQLDIIGRDASKLDESERHRVILFISKLGEENA